MVFLDELQYYRPTLLFQYDLVEKNEKTELTSIPFVNVAAISM